MQDCQFKKVMNGKLIIFSAPSGSGKTTIVRELLKHYPQFEFSISATSRAPRGVEQNGVDYYFLTQEEFAAKVASDSFVEWEEVYAGTCYGTLKSEMERIWSKGNVIIFDVDVMGGINLKKIFGEAACSILLCRHRWRSCRSDWKVVAPTRQRLSPSEWQRRSSRFRRLPSSTTRW